MQEVCKMEGNCQHPLQLKIYAVRFGVGSVFAPLADSRVYAACDSSVNILDLVRPRQQL